MITRDHVPRRTDQCNLHTQVIVNKNNTPVEKNKVVGQATYKVVGQATYTAGARSSVGVVAGNLPHSLELDKPQLAMSADTAFSETVKGMVFFA